MKFCPNCYNRPYADKETNCEQCGGPLQVVPQKAKGSSKKSLFPKKDAPSQDTTTAPVAPGHDATAAPVAPGVATADTGKKAGKKEKPAKEPKAPKAGKKKKGQEPAPVPQRQGTMFQKTESPGAEVAPAPSVAPAVAEPSPVASTAEPGVAPPVGQAASAEGSIFRKRVPPPEPAAPEKKSLFGKKK